MPATPRSTGFSFGISGLVHGCILSWVAFGTPPEVPEPRRNIYDELIKPHESRIIWYHLNDRMPDVAPGRKRAEAMRASVKAPHTVVSGARDDARPAQLIWMPDAQMPAPKPVPLPNVVAVAPKLRRWFTPPVAHAETPKPKLTEAPEAAMPSSKASMPDLGQQQRLRRQWTPPPAEPVRKAAPVLTEAPDAALASAKVTNPDVLGSRALHRPFTPPTPAAAKKAAPTLMEAPAAALPLASAKAAMPDLGKRAGLHRPWTPPKAQPVTKAAPALNDAPDAALAASTTAMPDVGGQRALHRPWTPPAGATARTAAPTLADAPVAAPPDTTQTATLAIVGLNPAPARDLPPPTTSRAAGFSAGAEIRAGERSEEHTSDLQSL